MPGGRRPRRPAAGGSDRAADRATFRLHEHDRRKPTLRGRLHQWAAVAVVLLAVPFTLHASPGGPRLGAGVFAASLVVLFATSATYHLGDWDGPWTLRMKRADHVAILVLIAGTYTGVGLSILDGWMLAVVVGGVWTAVLVGALAAGLGFFERFGAANSSYIVLGWLAVLMLPQLVSDLVAFELVLVVAGGVIYTVGAVFLALRRPDPWPETFGYHEVWHVCTLVAAACHGVVIFLVSGRV